MRRLVFTTLGCLLMSGFAVSAYAQQPAPVNIPEKVKANILKRYPKATDLQASHEIHFKRKLLEVSFKDEGAEAPILELYREDGHLFTNEMQLDDLSEAPSAVKAALDKEFPGYTLKKSEMIANPNGIGEEYEIYLLAGGVNWKVSITETGNIEGKDHF